MAASMSKSLIFLSSVQKELAAERQAVKEFVENDPLLRRFFTVFLFETLPASGRRADEVYLEEVDHCALYVGLFGNSYGFEDSEGISPTEREFDRATATGKERLIFVLGSDDSGHRRITWPTTRIAVASPHDLGRDVILIRGIEPNMRWRHFCAELLAATDDLGAKNRGDAEFFCNSLHTRHIGKADAENNRQSRTQMNPAARPDRK